MIQKRFKKRKVCYGYLFIYCRMFHLSCPHAIKSTVSNCEKAADTGGLGVSCWISPPHKYFVVNKQTLR